MPKFTPKSSQKQHFVHESLHRSGKAKTKVAKAARKFDGMKPKKKGR